MLLFCAHNHSHSVNYPRLMESVGSEGHLCFSNTTRPGASLLLFLSVRPCRNIYFADQGLPQDVSIRGRRAAADRGPKIVVAAVQFHPFYERTLHQAQIPFAVAVNPKLG